MRLKNALQSYFIQPITTDNANAATEDGWLELAKWISNVDDNSNEESETTGYYDGNGEGETDVTYHQLGYSFTGLYDEEDPAMAAIENMIGKSGDARKVWFKVISASGKKQRVGKATVTEPVAQVGDATAYGDFSCGIAFDSTPESTAVKP
ncbi:phage tail tube protein [Enterococcus durans]|uniref:phage tail tube protein n=1 Tax=Enterococcus durans TaxID=53345 RepID=UPI000CF0405E|nr:phage tail protein [Enterococcus durans]PQD37769.1 phage tail protein [Enterococcus durans]